MPYVRRTSAAVKPSTMPRQLAEAMCIRRDRGVVRDLIDWLACELRNGPIDPTWRASFGADYLGTPLEPIVRAALCRGYREEIEDGLEVAREMAEEEALYPSDYWSRVGP
jgi:hypothetical protein